MNVIYREGNYCDVAVWIDGRLLFVSAEGEFGTKLRCWLEDAPIWEATAGEGLLYCRGTVQGQQMVTVHQGHKSGSAILLNDRQQKSLGPSRGVQPVGIDQHEAYVIRPQFGQYSRSGLIDQTYAFPENLPPDSSQGFSDVQPDGNLWFADLHRTVVINGVTFTKPNVREYQGLTPSVTVGQVDGGIAAAVGGKVTLVIPSTLADDPHVAISPTGRVAICARTNQRPKGAAYVATSIQELS